MNNIYVTIYRLYHAGKTEEAERLFARILPVLAFSNQHLDFSIRFFKRLLFRQGIYPTAGVREPLLPFDKIHEEIADQWITMVIGMEKDLGEN